MLTSTSAPLVTSGMQGPPAQVQRGAAITKTDPQGCMTNARLEPDLYSCYRGREARFLMQRNILRWVSLSGS